MTGELSPVIHSSYRSFLPIILDSIQVRIYNKPPRKMRNLGGGDLKKGVFIALSRSPNIGDDHFGCLLNEILISKIVFFSKHKRLNNSTE